MKNWQFIVLCLLILLQPIIIYFWWWYRIEYIFENTYNNEHKLYEVMDFIDNANVFMNNIDNRTWK